MNSEIDEENQVSEIHVNKEADSSKEEQNGEDENNAPTHSNDNIKKRKSPIASNGETSSNANGESSACKKVKSEDTTLEQNEAPTTERPSALPSAVKIHIKTEPKEEPTSADEDDQPQPSCSTDIKPPVKVEKADATSTTSPTRQSCRFGIRCYRRNPMHRQEEAHPGDQDYKRPNYPTPPLGTPDCAYGDGCYRRNPEHFRLFSHPPDTNFEMNYRLRKRQQRQRNSQTQADNNTSEDEDPFADDDEEEYVPSEDDMEDEDETEDFLADYDDCDKVEE